MVDSALSLIYTLRTPAVWQCGNLLGSLFNSQLFSLVKSSCLILPMKLLTTWKVSQQSGHSPCPSLQPTIIPMRHGQEIAKTTNWGGDCEECLGQWEVSSYPIATNDLSYIEFSIILHAHSSGQDTPTWIIQSCSKGGMGSLIQASATVPLNMQKISWHLPVPAILPHFQTCKMMGNDGSIKHRPLAHHFQAIQECPDCLPAPLHSNLGFWYWLGAIMDMKRSCHV